MANLNPAASAILSATAIPTRDSLARTISALRRVRPRVPFFKLPAHRIPTRWSLYRGLLQCLPRANSRYQRVYDVTLPAWDSRLHGQAILWWVRRAFREQRKITSPQTTRIHLIFWHKLLDSLQMAPSDARKKETLARYERLLAARKERFEMEILYKKELAWIERMRNRAILSGGHLRPSVNNRPLPRFYRQPIQISMMIRKRIKAKTRRLERQTELESWVADLKAEDTFESVLWKEGLDPVDNEPASQYGVGTKSVLQTIKRAFELDKERSTSIYSPEMLASIKRARTVKIENKTRQRQRELRGEITNRVIKQMGKGPPAHVLHRMSDEQRHVDGVMREVSTGGYSGRIKAEERAKRRRLTKNPPAKPRPTVPAGEEEDGVHVRIDSSLPCYRNIHAYKSGK